MASAAGEPVLINPAVEQANSPFGTINGQTLSVREGADTGIPIRVEFDETDNPVFWVPMPGSETGLDKGWPTALSWLQRPGNLDRLREAVAQAKFVGELNPESVGSQGMVPYLNIRLQEWFRSNGVADEMRGMSTSSSSGDQSGTVLHAATVDSKCRDIPICTGCKTYVCGWFAGYYICNCYAIGQSCCVIN